MDEELYILDLVDVKTLQRIQDAFADMTGMAALTTDAHGVAVTNGSNFTDFCMKHTRQSELGKRRCNLCDKLGAEITLERGNSCSYYCHAGLVDFAAPIMANGKMIGSFIGGQVLTSPPDLRKFEQIAVELGISPHDYKTAVTKVKIVSKATIDRSAEFLSHIASVFSDIAYKSYELNEKNKEIEKASHAKSDFLANMSHEIRTPMNAVLGMADMALREELPPLSRAYIHQIKAAGKNLLVIINDILDFSKIESGKMEIIEDEYEPLSIVNDLASIVCNRIGDKNIEFIMDINPELPKKLKGDNVRIHQVILNLLTNAVKFTHEGCVKLFMDCYKKDDETEILKIAVSDTGIGIKKEEMSKVFDSFQQADSKRNRNIEGTGLGLSITNQLLHLMKSEIHLESEYNKGSTFSFELPQKIVDNTPTFSKSEITSKYSAAVLITNHYVKEQLIKDLEWCGIEWLDLMVSNYLETTIPDFIFVQRTLFDDNIKSFLDKNSFVKCCVVISNFNSTFNIDMNNVITLRKPVYFLNLYNTIGISDIHVEDVSDVENINYIAPDAKILIVDDNKINLTVATGLLEPLKLKIDTAESAKESFVKINENKYDIVFMDHMMPEIDGVEATKMIHEQFPDYDNVPIIALTANAMGGAKEMFISAGMSDFVPKPIEFKNIVSTIRKWLPDTKIIETDGIEETETNQVYEEDEFDNIPNLNVKSAVSMLGSKDLFKTILREYYFAIDKKTQTIRNHKNMNDIRNYTIEVHSLKSTSRQIGADYVSSLAAELEAAGNSNNIEKINEKTEIMLEEFNKYKEILAPYFANDEKNQPKKSADRNEVLSMLEQLNEAIANFDTLQLDEIVEKMSGYEYSESENQLLERLKETAEAFDLDEALAISEEWRSLI